MTKPNKTIFLASVSAAALGVMSVAPASAFDEVNWSWNADVSEVVSKDISITADIVPTGMVMVEDLQVYIGNLDAVSTVTGIENNQAVLSDAGGGPETFDFQYNTSGEIILSDGVVGGTIDEDDPDPLDPTIDGSGSITIDLNAVIGEPADALSELPEVVSAATAVANNTAIDSDVMVELHEGQFAFNVEGDDGNSGGGNDKMPYVPDAETGNSNLTAAGVLGVLAITGDILPSQIGATSTVTDILNAAVDSSATAVANNMSISLEPKSPGDSVLIADIVQFAYADISATSSVSGVSLNNYTNLGLIESPVVNSVATAVGNNKSISVVSPVVALP
jgi:hypothetical protein